MGSGANVGTRALGMEEGGGRIDTSAVYHGAFVGQGCDRPFHPALFFAMEYVEGENVESIVDRHRENGAFVPILRATNILEQVAAGLHAIHLAGHVHRDVKPANVVIEESTGRPVVVDLGLASSMDE